MTSVTSAQSSLNRRTGVLGFTMLELIVVMMIITILTVIVVPMIVRGRKAAVNTRVAADLQAIAVALDAYKQDMGDYPRLPRIDDRGYPTAGGFYDLGAILLAQSLVAPGPIGFDGADGPGFRKGTRTSGQVFGPYLAADRFQMTSNGADAMLLDYWGRPILYFAARVGGGLADTSNSFVAPSDDAIFNYADNDPSTGVTAFSSLVTINNAEEGMRVMLGDYDADGAITGSEARRVKAPFFLWSAGLDGTFAPLQLSSPTDAATNLLAVQKCDDIGNFEQ